MISPKIIIKTLKIIILTSSLYPQFTIADYFKINEQCDSLMKDINGGCSPYAKCIPDEAVRHHICICNDLKRTSGDYCEAKQLPVIYDYEILYNKSRPNGISQEEVELIDDLWNITSSHDIDFVDQSDKLYSTYHHKPCQYLNDKQRLSAMDKFVKSLNSALRYSTRGTIDKATDELRNSIVHYKKYDPKTIDGHGTPYCSPQFFKTTTSPDTKYVIGTNCLQDENKCRVAHFTPKEVSELRNKYFNPLKPDLSEEEICHFSFAKYYLSLTTQVFPVIDRSSSFNDFIRNRPMDLLVFQDFDIKNISQYTQYLEPKLLETIFEPGNKNPYRLCDFSKGLVCQSNQATGIYHKNLCIKCPVGELYIAKFRSCLGWSGNTIGFFNSDILPHLGEIETQNYYQDCTENSYADDSRQFKNDFAQLTNSKYFGPLIANKDRNRIQAEKIVDLKDQRIWKLFQRATIHVARPLLLCKKGLTCLENKCRCFEKFWNPNNGQCSPITPKKLLEFEKALKAGPVMTYNEKCVGALENMETLKKDFKNYFTGIGLDQDFIKALNNCAANPQCQNGLDITSSILIDFDNFYHHSSSLGICPGSKGLQCKLQAGLDPKTKIKICQCKDDQQIWDPSMDRCVYFKKFTGKQLAVIERKLIDFHGHKTDFQSCTGEEHFKRFIKLMGTLREQRILYYNDGDTQLNDFINTKYTDGTLNADVIRYIMANIHGMIGSCDESKFLKCSFRELCECVTEDVFDDFEQKCVIRGGEQCDKNSEKKCKKNFICDKHSEWDLTQTYCVAPSRRSNGDNEYDYLSGTQSLIKNRNGFLVASVFAICVTFMNMNYFLWMNWT